MNIYIFKFFNHISDFMQIGFLLIVASLNISLGNVVWLLCKHLLEKNFAF